jgi:hypothetical protein
MLRAEGFMSRGKLRVFGPAAGEFKLGVTREKE